MHEFFNRYTFECKPSLRVLLRAEPHTARNAQIGQITLCCLAFLASRHLTDNICVYISAQTNIWLAWKVASLFEFRWLHFFDTMYFLLVRLHIWISLAEKNLQNFTKKYKMYYKKIQEKTYRILHEFSNNCHVPRPFLKEYYLEWNSVIFVVTTSTEVWTVSSRTFQQDKHGMCRIDKSCPRLLINDRGIAGWAWGDNSVLRYTPERIVRTERLLAIAFTRYR